MICTNFFFSKKEVEIKYCDITNIYGGIVSGWQTRPIYFVDSKNQTIGVFTNAGRNNLLVETIFKNIKEDLYQRILKEMKETRG